MVILKNVLSRGAVFAANARIYAFPCLWGNKSVSEYVERNEV